MNYLISIIMLFALLEPGYYDSKPGSFFDWFTYRIAYSETRNTHSKNGNVITNSIGMVGENQINPDTAEFIQNKYNYSCDIAELNCNRRTRDDYIRWLRDRGLKWWEVANCYNVGHNSKWINTNYVFQVMGKDYFTNEVVIRAKKGSGNYYLVQFRGDNEKMHRMRKRARR